MTLCFDAHFAPGLAVALSAVGAEAIHVETEFYVGVKDTVWLPVAGEKGWIVVTNDRFRGHPKAAALEAANVTVVWVAAQVLKNHGAMDQLQWFTKHYKRIHDAVLASHRGTQFRISERGIITRVST